MQHNTEFYLKRMMEKYTMQPPCLTSLHKQVSRLRNFIKQPKVKQDEIHHFTHRNTASLSIDGEFLCFVSHVVLKMDSADSGEYSFNIQHQEIVSSQSIQLQRKKFNLPADFERLCSQGTHGDYEEYSERASITLKTFIRSSLIYTKEVAIKHKVIT